VVTGASRGLGKAAYAKPSWGRGAQVCDAGTVPGGFERRGPRELGPSAKAWVTDIADPKAVRRSFEAITETFGWCGHSGQQCRGGTSAAELKRADDALAAGGKIATNLLGPDLLHPLGNTPTCAPAAAGEHCQYHLRVRTDGPYPFLTVYAAAKKCRRGPYHLGCILSFAQQTFE